MKRVVMTGAAGGVGTMLRPRLKALYPDLVLSDLRRPADLGADERFIGADLTDNGALAAALEGAEGIVHLGGYSVEGPWPEIMRANIAGAYNLFEAARGAGVKRIVFASSNHAVGFYRRNHRIDPDVTARPDSRYGVSKVFGEALAAFYADKFGIGITCLRIGNVADRPVDVRRLAIWLHPADLAQLVRIGLEHPDISYEVFYGASDNQAAWWDNARAFALGYRPAHRAEDHRAYALAEQAKLPPDPVGDLFQGGSFCSAEFANDPARAGK